MDRKTQGPGIGRQPFIMRDVEEMAAKHPTSFHIYPRELRSGLPIDSQAKIIFAAPGEDGREPADRMWVRVTKRDIAVDGQSGWYEGVVMNYSVFVDIGWGETVQFGPEHIADMEHPMAYETKVHFVEKD